MKTQSSADVMFEDAPPIATSNPAGTRAAPFSVLVQRGDSLRV